MLGVPLLSSSRVLAPGIFLFTTSLTVPAAACPSGSQFFAYGGAGGCVTPGSNKVVVRCFSMGKVCPSGWSNEGQSEGKSGCCPPLAQTKVCVLRGTAPFCDGECEVGETLKSRTAPRTQGCVTGSKAYCCRL